MSFKDDVAQDIMREFLNLDEFAEIHEYGPNNKPIKCVFDEDILTESTDAGDLSVTRSTFTLYAREEDIERQTEGTNIQIDGRLYTVINWRVDMGVHRVMLFEPTTYGGW